MRRVAMIPQCTAIAITIARSAKRERRSLSSQAATRSNAPVPPSIVDPVFLSTPGGIDDREGRRGNPVADRRLLHAATETLADLGGAGRKLLDVSCKTGDVLRALEPLGFDRRGTNFVYQGEDIGVP